MKVLVTGRAGQLARGLAERAAFHPALEIVFAARPELDLADERSIRSVIRAVAPDVVVNAAAYTAVDRAEREVAAAWRANAIGPAVLAEACRAADVPLVHVSTDYVFAGDKAEAWEVDDAVAPPNVYGASKLAGEIAVRAGCPRHAIVRTAWLVSAGGANFVTTMLRLAAQHDRVRVVADQHGSPTGADDLAAALARIAARLIEDPDGATGTFHFANAGATTWHGFAEAIFARSAIRGGPSAVVEPVATSDYPTAAVRPVNSVLSTQRIARPFGIVPRPWQAALDDILDALIGPAPAIDPPQARPISVASSRGSTPTRS